MGILDDIRRVRRESMGGEDRPFLIQGTQALGIEDLAAHEPDLSQVRPGDVVALIADFDAPGIATLLALFDRKAIVVPLLAETRADHDYYLEAAHADVVIEGGQARRLAGGRRVHPLLDQLRSDGHPGLVIFSSGTTGRPKAILHDFARFRARFDHPGPGFRTLSFLLFDHVGGLNTLFQALFYGGQIVRTSARDPLTVAGLLSEHRIELFPATPTFLRLMLMAGVVEAQRYPDLKILNYGTERMDQATLDRLCAALPHVNIRQGYGLSELGIMKVRPEGRSSLWFELGGEGVETRIDQENVLHIRSANRMLGYMNAPDPFEDGWYATGDIVETRGTLMRIAGRKGDMINVGGLKILPSEVERAALACDRVLRAKAVGAPNPITGQHIEVTCQLREGSAISRAELRDHFRKMLPETLLPHRIRIGEVPVSHRFKQA